jgi:hypothetical protein
MHWMITFLLPLCLLGHAAQQTAKFPENQCRTVAVSKGEIGEGKLSYCDNGTDQEIYLSGELYLRPTDRNMKSAADFLALKQILREFKKRDKGTFRVVTNNAGGGEIDWHQALIMAVENACIKDCRIITEVKGRCESACNQLHITCVSNARTILHNGARTCEHATTDEDDPKCNKRDPFDSGERYLCSAQVAVEGYKERCDELVEGRNLSIDLKRKRQIFEFLDMLARRKVFDTTKLTCTPLPWAETGSPALGTHASGVPAR